MTDIELVIKIPEEKLSLIKNKRYCGLYDSDLYKAIANGIALPKGHGDLKDTDAINERYYSIYDDAINCSNQPTYKYLLDKWSMCLDTAPTIIEADKEN